MITDIDTLISNLVELNYEVLVGTGFDYKSDAIEAIGKKVVELLDLKFERKISEKQCACGRHCCAGIIKENKFIISKI